jgi:hypothetical protein
MFLTIPATGMGVRLDQGLLLKKYVYQSKIIQKFKFSGIIRSGG